MLCPLQKVYHVNPPQGLGGMRAQIGHDVIILSVESVKPEVMARTGHGVSER